MRKPSVYEEPDLAIAEALAELDLWRCHQCGQCTAVCPSGRQNGIRTRETLERAGLGTLDLAKDEGIWLCMMCYSCSERCQLGVDPASVIASLRSAAARDGNLPKHLENEAVQFCSTALSFPNTGMTRKMRRELDLPDLVVTDEALQDVISIVSKTRLGRLKLD